MENNKTLGLKPEDFEELKDILHLRLKKLKKDNIKIYAFGSRVKGKSNKTSDIDLAIDANREKLPFLFIEAIKNLLSASEIPYKVDIIDLNEISESFKSSIKDDLVEIDYGGK
jgi:predicted nucleotidyltransferase